MIPTLLCGLSGLAAAAAGRWAPAYEVPLYVVSYATGGYGPGRDLLDHIRRRELDINLLMVAAAAGSAILGHWGEGAVLLFLFSLSGALERLTMERTARTIGSLVELRPDTALVVRDGVETRVRVEEIDVGESVRAKPGERFAVDGTVVEGTTTADESTITGESVPVEKEPGDLVYAGTMNLQGAPLLRVTKGPSETTLSRIVRAVQEAPKRKSSTERFVHRWQRFYVIAVFGAAALAVAFSSLARGASFEDSFYLGLVLLVAASPCAVVIATPAAMLSAITRGARRGVLFKGSRDMERLAEVSALALDKTGTVTHGKLRVTGIVPTGGGREPEEILRLAAAVEARSEHHAGRAIAAEAAARGLTLPSVAEFESHSGKGVHGRVEGAWVGVGREELLAGHAIAIPGAALGEAARVRGEGKTAHIVLVMSGADGDGDAHPGASLVASGVIAVADTVRGQAKDAIRACRAQGVKHVAILTGDHEAVARPVAAEVGADEVFASLLPEAKVERLRALLRKWPSGVAMVGDGVNDAPALATATVGIAMGGAGTDVALDTADVVLMRDELSGIPFALWLAKRAQRTVSRSLTFAFSLIGVLVLATLSGVLPLWLAVICHEGSTLLVIANGVRLLALRPPAFVSGS
jgi:Cd2+/Zn2+-exporting ATPase